MLMNAIERSKFPWHYNTHPDFSTFLALDFLALDIRDPNGPHKT